MLNRQKRGRAAEVCVIMGSDGHEQRFVRIAHAITEGPMAGCVIEEYFDATGIQQHEERLGYVNSVMLSLDDNHSQNLDRILNIITALTRSERTLFIDGDIGHQSAEWISGIPSDIRPLFKESPSIVDHIITGGHSWLFMTPEICRSLSLSAFPDALRSGVVIVGQAVMDGETLLGALFALYNGEYRPTTSDTWLLGIAASMLAVEEKRHRILIARAQKEREHAMILDSISDLVMHLDPRMSILWTNKAGTSIMKQSLASLTGIHCFTALYNRTEACPSCPAAESLHSGKPVEKEMKTPDGKSWFLKSYPIIGENGAVEGVVEIGRDISERKLLESKFMQAQKMEVVGRFAGGIAHDFNNLLSIIIGFADLFLLSHHEGDLGDIIEIKKTAERAGKLSHQLLTFSRQQIIQPQIIVPNELLVNMNKMLRRLIGTNIELVTLIEDTLWPIQVDFGQFEQVITNIVVNACDAMPSGGKITIQTENNHIPADSNQLSADMPSGDYVRVSISDTGMGMDEDTLAKAFEPFFTTKGFGKGTGLGLATCYGIVKQSGGEIVLSSQLGLGTTVSIFFPRATQEITQLSTAQSYNEIRGGTETILLVEDDQLLNEMIGRFLKKRGYHVLQAMYGEEALRILDHDATSRIHMVITDLVMPQMGGIELMKKIRKTHKEMKVLYISGYADDTLNNVEKDLMKEHFLQKPFSSELLARKVRTILDSNVA